MTDRVLRWLSAISLVVLALSMTWTLATMTRVAAPLTLVPYILDVMLLPRTALAVGEITGVATLVVSLQRRQWGWVVGTLLALVVHFYGGLALTFPIGVNLLYALGSGTYPLRVTLYSFLVLTPLVLVATVYAWTRRQLSAPLAEEAGGS